MRMRMKCLVLAALLIACGHEDTKREDCTLNGRRCHDYQAENQPTPVPEQIPGPIGATGPAGSRGEAGEAGHDGLNGATGQPGGQGPAGSQGLPGSIGPTGATGPAGAEGAAGTPGTNAVLYSGITGPEVVGKPYSACHHDYLYLSNGWLLFRHQENGTEDQGVGTTGFDVWNVDISDFLLVSETGGVTYCSLHWNSSTAVLEYTVIDNTDHLAGITGEIDL